MGNNNFNRRTFTVFTAMSAASMAVSDLLWAQARPEKAHVTIATSGKSTFDFLPLTIANQLGYFKAEGLDVQILDFPGGSRTIQAAVSGQADVVAGPYDHTISQQARGLAFQSFVLQSRAPGVALGISPRALPDFKSVGDLKGRKIGVWASGSPSHLMATMVLWRAGLKPADVTFVPVGTGADALNAFRSGHLDALCNVDPVLTVLEQKDEIRIVSDTRTLKGTVEVFGGPMPGGCLYAPATFIQKNPHTVQGLTSAITHSLKWLQTAGPGDILKAVPEAYLLGDRALYLAAFDKVRESLSLDGLIPDSGPQTALKALARFDQSFNADKIELSQTYSNEFARKAKARFEV